MLDPIVTLSTDLPVTLAFAKAHSVIDFADDDDLVEAYIRAAASHLDGPSGILGRAMLPQTVAQSFCQVSERMVLPYGPASAVLSVEYYDEDNALQSLVDWALLAQSGRSFVYFSGDIPATYDRPDAVTVNYSAGFQDVASIPYDLRLAIVQLASAWYETREAVSEKGQNIVPFGVYDMIAPHCRVPV